MTQLDENIEYFDEEDFSKKWFEQTKPWENDDYFCAMCRTNSYLCAHVERVTEDSYYINFRPVILCKECHKKVHEIMDREIGLFQKANDRFAELITGADSEKITELDQKLCDWQASRVAIEAYSIVKNERNKYINSIVSVIYHSLGCKKNKGIYELACKKLSEMRKTGGAA